MQKARNALQQESDIVKILRNLRFYSKAIDLLLGTEESLKLKSQSKFITIKDLDESVDTSANKNSNRIDFKKR